MGKERKSNSLGHYWGQYFVYDAMGRLGQQTNPTETGATGPNWVATGDDDPNNGGNGWVYSQQTYDWKGRPLVTTNQDGTTKEASYGGCGCAGGEVVTLTDEGTMVNGVTKKRQQKIYSDALGRTYKTETLNWDGPGSFGTGGSIYATTLTTYNARDQLTLIRQFQGADTSGVYQDTTMSYDGYGRLQTKHVPEQDAGTSTTYFYNPDDTIYSVTDARGAVQLFSYNGRHLVTAINYSAPSGIAPTANVSFTYDPAGNRASMTDGLGFVNYGYDQLSRMTSETRSFTGVGVYPINYSYNPSGQLTNITDPFNAQVEYDQDTIGRVSAVSGSGFGDISTYASNFQYRASGALKHLTYGNSRSLEMTYNPRLQTTHFQVSGVSFYPSQPNMTSLDYHYSADGRVKHVDDLLHSQFTRAYSYDQVGRVIEASSGLEAGGGGASVADSPYHQTYGYDVWSNITERTERHWSKNIPTYSTTYTNNRTGNGYDADGRPTIQGSLNNTFDAAGQATEILDTAHRSSGSTGTSLSLAYDGDGRRLRQNDGGVITYYLRSTVLRGEVVTDLTAQGQKQTGYVYALGHLLAKQNTYLNVAFYQHGEPSHSSKWESYNHPDGTIVAAATLFDPLGNNVGEEDPYLDGGGIADSDLNKSYPEAGDASDLPFGCTVDGLPWPCTMALKYAATNPSGVSVNVTGHYIDTLGGFFGGGMLRWNPGSGSRLLGSESHQNQDGTYDASVTVAPDNSDGYFDWVVGNPTQMVSGYFERPLLPQKTYLTNELISGLKKDLQDMLANPDCAKFAKALLNELGNSYSDDPIKLFNKVGEQGGFYEIPKYPPWGEAPGTVGAGNAAIGIVLLKQNQGAAIFHNNLARTLFHEIVHGSTNSRNSVGHPEMAQAAYVVALAQGYKNVPKPPQPGSDDYDYQSSTYFEARVFAACGPRTGGKRK